MGLHDQHVDVPQQTILACEAVVQSKAAVKKDCAHCNPCKAHKGVWVYVVQRLRTSQGR